jgi:hypothetical protein
MTSTSPSLPAFSDAGFGDLDSLMDEAMAEAAEKDAIKLAKAKIARGGPNPSEFAADRARVKVWEDQNEWRKVANVAKFTCTDCACGEYTGIFAGFLTKEEHRHLRGTFRYLPLPKGLPMSANLPNLTVQEVVHTPVCAACALDKGWDMSQAEQWGV